MIEFRMLNENWLYDYKEACFITQGLDSDGFFIPIGDENKEVRYWVRQMVANHSTIRSVRFRMKASAPKSVVMQIIRATKGHPQPEVQSSRPDWCGKERSNDPYEEKLFIQDHTAESFIEMAKQRLCNRTEERTRQFMNEACISLWKSDIPFFKALALCCKPACGWLRGCPELKSCGKCEKLSAGFIEK